MSALTEADLARFRDEGWTTVAGLFEPDECDAIVAAAADGFTMPVGAAEDGPLDYRPMQHVANRDLRRWATDPRWAALALPLVGPDVRLYWEQLVTKPPRSETLVPWHQDNGYAPVEPQAYLTCWLALEDATLDNGCMWLLPGSHRGGTVAHHDTGGFFQVGYDGPDEGVPVELAKGDVLCFSSLSQHRSGPNRTDGHRRAWIVQFCEATSVHGRTGQPLDNRLLVAEAGTWLAEPVRARRFELADL